MESQGENNMAVTVTFMMKEATILRHLGSERWIEDDKAKIEVIEMVIQPTTIRESQRFL